MINRLYVDYRVVHLLSAMALPYARRGSFFPFFSLPLSLSGAALSLFISLVSRNRNIFLSLKITHDANAPGIIGRICSRR